MAQSLDQSYLNHRSSWEFDRNQYNLTEFRFCAIEIPTGPVRPVPQRAHAVRPVRERTVRGTPRSRTRTRHRREGAGGLGPDGGTAPAAAGARARKDMLCDMIDVFSGPSSGCLFRGVSSHLQGLGPLALFERSSPPQSAHLPTPLTHVYPRLPTYPPTHPPTRRPGSATSRAWTSTSADPGQTRRGAGPPPSSTACSVRALGLRSKSSR